MYILLVIFLLLVVLIYLAFIEPLRVSFLLDSDKMKMMVWVTWLKVIKAEIRVIEFKPHITLYFYGKRIYSKTRKKAMKTDTDNLRALSLSDTRIKTFYGLNKPHLTGLLYIAAEFLGSLTEAELEQHPEYVPTNEYLRIEAETCVNIGGTIANLVELKSNKNKRRERPWISLR